MGNELISNARTSFRERSFPKFNRKTESSKTKINNKKVTISEICIKGKLFGNYLEGIEKLFAFV